jgi:tRNA 2-selenouridine synthase
VYCWRGGTRSGALASVLQQIGWRANRLDGGYKTYRRAVIDDLAVLPGRFTWRVICGLTGSGKSRLLRALANAGAQVLDLEALAAHRGSVLGNLPDAPQP